MADPVSALKVVLADTFALYLKAHNYHWNVEGPDFPQLHSFFGSFYEELHGSIDSIAEHIRTLDAYAPGSFLRFSELTTIEDEVNIPTSSDMCRRLMEDNEKVIASLHEAFGAAEDAGLVGISDFVQGRIDTHHKHAWMLRSITKNR